MDLAKSEDVDSVPFEMNEMVYGQLVRSQSSSTASIDRNLIVQNQNISSMTYSIENSTGVHIGTMVNIDLQIPQNINNQRTLQTSEQVRQDEIKTYKKTPTVKMMMECKDRLSDGFLDHICKHFGERWKDVTFFLDIDPTLVGLFNADDKNSGCGSTKEVSFHIFSLMIKF